MIDYRHIIDDATWQFIEKTNSFYPENVVDATVGEQRAIYNAMCAAFHAGIPKDVVVTDGNVGSVPVRQYHQDNSSGPIVVYMHGGGFVVGGLLSHDDVCAEICAATGLRVTSVDYRLSPEHPHPGAYDDCQTVFDHLIADPVILCGDSAGGNLAAALAHNNRGTPVLGQVLIYPGLGGDMNRGSYQRHAQAPMLTRDDILFHKDVRGPIKAGDTRASPLSDTDFSALPPTVAIAAECDPLADDARQYRDAIQAAGGRAIFIEETGLVHGFLRARHMAPRARAGFARITRAITGMAARTPLCEIELL